MPTRTGRARWEGGFLTGHGVVGTGSGAVDGRYSFTSRFEEGPGTNPEELLGAAHAGCFTMAFSGHLERAGYSPDRVATTADVFVEPVEDGYAITRIHLRTGGHVPGCGPEEFQRLAQLAKRTCPVSSVLTGAQVTLHATLE